MKLKVVVHEAEEGGYWAEVPAIPGCATQAESFEELLSNLYEAVEGCLSESTCATRTGTIPEGNLGGQQHPHQTRRRSGTNGGVRREGMPAPRYARDRRPDGSHLIRDPGAAPAAIRCGMRQPTSVMIRSRD